MDLQAHQASGQLAASLWRTLIDNFFYSQNHPPTSDPSNGTSATNSSNAAINTQQQHQLNNNNSQDQPFNPFNFPLNLTISTPMLPNQFNVQQQPEFVINQQLQHQQQMHHQQIQQQQHQIQHHHQQPATQTRIVNKPSKKRLIPAIKSSHNNSNPSISHHNRSQLAVASSPVKTTITTTAGTPTTQLDCPIKSEFDFDSSHNNSSNLDSSDASSQNNDDIDVEDEQSNDTDQTQIIVGSHAGSHSNPITINDSANNKAREPPQANGIAMQTSSTSNNTSTTTTSSGSKQKRLYKCHSCTFETDRKSDYWIHIRVHMRPEKQLACELCQFVTQYKHHLEYHQRNHSGFKPFKCDHCDYSCVNKSMLNSHMKSHSSIYQYQCGDCKYVTKYVHSLKMHLRKYDHKPAQLMIDVYGRRRGPKSATSNSNSQTNSNNNSKNNSNLNSPTGTPATQCTVPTGGPATPLGHDLDPRHETKNNNDNSTIPINSASKSSSCNLSIRCREDKGDCMMTDGNNNDDNGNPNLHVQNPMIHQIPSKTLATTTNNNFSDNNDSNAGFHSQQQTTNAINSILDLRVDSKFSDS